MITNADTILFRCSQLGKIMTEPREKAKKESKELSETTKTYLTELYVAEKYGREKELENKYITKGLRVEEDSITAYTLFTGQMFFKNEERIQDDHFIGTPDLYVGETIKTAKKIIDVKSSWNIWTFFANHPDKINKMYVHQLHGYMALSTASESELGYCLIDTPMELVNDERRKLMWKMGVMDDMNPLFMEAESKLEKNLLYPDIPIEERVLIVPVPRNEDLITAMREKVELCRWWMNRELFKVVTVTT